MTAADGGEGVTVTIRHGEEIERLTVSVADYTALSPTKGETDEAAYFALLHADARYRAVRAALRLLAVGQCSKYRLQQKLRARHFAPEDAEYAATFAAENGYLDESWQILSYLKLLICKKQYGRRKIFPVLLAKGYRADQVREILAENFCDEDFAAAKSAFLERKFGKTVPESAEEARAMKAALYKQGF